MCWEARDGGSSFPPWLAHNLGEVAQPLMLWGLVWSGPADHSFSTSGLGQVTVHFFIHSASVFELLLSARHHSFFFF